MDMIHVSIIPDCLAFVKRLTEKYKMMTDFDK